MSGEVSDFMQMDYPDSNSGEPHRDIICSDIICDYCSKQCRLNLRCIDQEYEFFSGKQVVMVLPVRFK